MYYYKTAFLQPSGRYPQCLSVFSPLCFAVCILAGQWKRVTSPTDSDALDLCTTITQKLVPGMPTDMKTSLSKKYIMMFFDALFSLE